MLGKRLIYKRSVMIAITVFALMTLTAGVAAAASLKAKNIEASGTVDTVQYAAGATIKSKFKYDKETGEIKSVKINTKGEQILGGIDTVDGCDPQKPTHAGVCLLVKDMLEGGGILSTHSSKAVLTVYSHDVSGGTFPFPVLWGTLKGSLNAKMTFTPEVGDVMTGKGKLKIKSPSSAIEHWSAYACFTGASFAPIDDCAQVHGKPVFGVDPVMIPVLLQVEDSGKLKLKSKTMELSAKIDVAVTSSFFFGTTGTISLSDGKAKIK